VRGSSVDLEGVLVEEIELDAGRHGVLCRSNDYARRAAAHTAMNTHAVCGYSGWPQRTLSAS
jgi:hypothetical protein